MDFIRKENIKTLLEHIVEQHIQRSALAKLLCIRVFVRSLHMQLLMRVSQFCMFGRLAMLTHE